MKKIFILVLLLLFLRCSYAQQALSLKMRPYESFGGISALSNTNTWAITFDFTIYNTSTKGWNKTHSHGLVQNSSVIHLQTINFSAALLTVYRNFSNDKNAVYKTTDEKYKWNQVFAYRKSHEIKPGIYNKNAALPNCNFSSFSDSAKACMQLYCTKGCMILKSFCIQHKT